LPGWLAGDGGEIILPPTVLPSGRRTGDSVQDRQSKGGKKTEEETMKTITRKKKEMSGKTKDEKEKYERKT